MTALAVPSLPELWTPWRRPPWRAPLAHLLHLKKGPDGHLIKNAARHLVKDCGGTPMFCGGTCVQLPLSVSLAFSGITICPGCSVSDLDGDRKQKNLISSFSGTYTLPRVEAGDGSPCHFRLVTSYTGAFEYYEFVTCGGTHTSSDTLSIQCELGFEPHTGVHGVMNIDAAITGAGGGVLAIFHHGLPVATDCSSSPVADSDYGPGDCTTRAGSQIPNGGSVAVSFNY